MRLKYVLALFLTCPLSNLLAQDTNNWTNQYGSRSALMGGAVVGGVRDTSAGYYNPGALGYISNDSVTVSGNAYTYSDITVENGAGTGKDLDSKNIQAIPTLLSGVVKFEGAENHTFGYTLLTKTDVSQKFTGRVDRRQNVLQDYYSPGEEEFVGQTNSEFNVKEYWAGGSYAYKLNENISIGGTLFGGLKNSKGTNFYFARAITEDGGLSTVSSTNTFDYYNIRGFGKFGIAADYQPLKMGLTITTPSFNLTGDGDVTTDITLTDLYLADETGSNLISATGNDRQDNLDAKVKSPFSVALGAEYEIENIETTVGVSAEYFDSQNLYNVLSTTERPFFRPSGVDFGTTNRDFLQIYSQAKSIVNYAVGMEQKINEKWKGYLSVRADRTTYEDSPDAVGTDASLLNYNLYHAVAGASYRTERSETSLGLQYSYGKNDATFQATDFSTASEENLFAGEDKQTDAVYRAVTLILGYTYFF